MPLSYEIVLQSKPFCFLVGPDRCEFYIHPPLLEHYSKSLNALVQGPMKEAKEQCAWLKEVDKGAFIRLVEFLYTGDYPAAEHSVNLDSENVGSNDIDLGRKSTVGEESDAVGVDDFELAADAVAEPVPDPWTTFDAPTKKYKKRAMSPKRPTKLQQAWQKFSAQHMDHTERLHHTERRNQKPWEDYAEVFLSHAKVYTLADAYDIESLRKLSLYRLHGTLCAFELFDERIGDISCLVEYVYNNTAEKQGPIDEMRALVIGFVACNVEKLMSDSVFRTTLGECTTASLDLVERLLDRLD